MKKSKKDFSFYMFPIIFLIIAVFYVFRYFFLNIDTEIIKYGEMEDFFETKAILVKNELVYDIPSDVHILNKAEEGQRVPFGKKLVDIVKGDILQEDLKTKIEELDVRIKEIENSKEMNFFEKDIERLEKSIDEKVEYIKILSNQGNFEKISEVKAQLHTDLSKKASIGGEKSFSGKNLSQLKMEKSQLEELYDNNMQTIVARSPGIVSFNIDGFEHSLKPENISKFTIEEIKNLINSLDRQNNHGEEPKGVKIIDNFSWYLCMIVDENFLEDLEIGKKVKIEFKGYENELIRAKVNYISEPENGEILVSYEITDNINNYYDKRLVDIKVITNQYEGFLVSEKCLVEIENQKGIYVIREGMIRFVAIDVIAIDNGYALIKNIDNKENVIKLSTGSVKIYDEVVKNTDKVKPNQRLL
ncbi:MAG: hypothetical protein GX201_00275 [Clostridiales bacterium]|nr:hypothetical protein [Clostridiales bacterium]